MDFSGLVENLERVGLEKFINANRFILCQKTINQSQIAAFLQFDSDQIEIIKSPSCSYSRSEKLYEYVEKTTRVENFLGALKETGNEHVIEFIQSALKQSMSSSQRASTSFNSKKEIWFNIPDPIGSFCGREDFLIQLHDKLQSLDDSTSKSTSLSVVTVLSQVKIVSGLGGIGKTQTAIKYISIYFQFYNNVIWIDAESENSMKNSFINLAGDLKIPSKNPEGKSRDIEEIVKELYNKICEGGNSNLLVFDNAQCFQSVQKFFPPSLHPSLKKPAILATSRNRDWMSPTGKIQVLPLDILTERESLNFVLKELEIPESPEFQEESKEFIQLIGGLPLALQQAVAYVKQQKKVNGLLGRPYELSDYVREFKCSAKKLQNFPGSGSTTVFITWNVTLEKIKREPRGKIALEIIQVMSFLYADKIPIEFLLQLLPLRLASSPQKLIQGVRKSFHLQKTTDPDLKSTELGEGLNLLEKFSMIKITGPKDGKKTFVSIHRQLQFVIMQNLKKSCGQQQKIDLFNQLVEKCSVILKTLHAQLSKSTTCDIFLNLHQILNSQHDFIPDIPLAQTEKILDFMYDFGFVLFRASRYSESLVLYKKVHKVRNRLLGENHEKTLAAQSQIALQLHQLGKKDESLTLFRQTVKKAEAHLGLNHPDTIATKHNTALVLRDQGKYQESLRLLQQVLKEREEILGENHQETLNTQSQIALVYSDLGNFQQAMALYDAVEKKENQNRSIIFGPYDDQNYCGHVGKVPSVQTPSVILPGPSRAKNSNNNLRPSSLISNYQKATVLCRLGEFEEALQLFNQVYHKRKEIFGQTHLHTINTLEWIAFTLEREEKFTDAVEVYTKVWEIRKESWSENHPDTINVKNKIAHLNFKVQLQEKDEPL